MCFYRRGGANMFVLVCVCLCYLCVCVDLGVWSFFAVERSVSGKRGRPRKDIPSSIFVTDFASLSDFETQPVPKRPRPTSSNSLNTRRSSSKSPKKDVATKSVNPPPNATNPPVPATSDGRFNQAPKSTPPTPQPHPTKSPEQTRYGDQERLERKASSLHNSRMPSPMEAYPKHTLDELFETVRRMQGRLDGLAERTTLRHENLNETPEKTLRGADDNVCCAQENILHTFASVFEIRKHTQTH